MKKQVEEKRKAPDFTGVPGILVESLDPALQFGKKKQSPYDALLDQLSVATDAAIAANRSLPGLRFSALKARASVYYRAQKKGIKVSFAETADGALYVRIEGRVDAIERRHERIKDLLKIGPQTTMVIVSKLRAAGDETCDGGGVEAMLCGMAKRGEVIRQEGAAWKLLAKKLQAA